MSRFKVIFFLVIISKLLLASSFIDEDLDGVDDRVDKCPNSSLFDIVDKTGCAIEHLKKEEISSYDFSLGFNYIKYEGKTYKNKSFSFSFYKNRFSVYIYNSFNKEGIEDITLELSYDIKSNHKLSLGFYLPTMEFEGNRLDYFIKYKYIYTYKQFDISFSYKYTFMNDKESRNINSFVLSLGGEINKRVYSAISYTYEESIYKSQKNIKDFSLYINYSINTHLYISTTLSKNIFSFNIGYSF